MGPGSDTRCAGRGGAPGWRRSELRTTDESGPAEVRVSAVLDYCDWSAVTDPGVLRAEGFPVVPAEQVAATVRRLDEAVRAVPGPS